MSRIRMVAGNWKMNNDFVSGLVLVNAILEQLGNPSPVRVLVLPPFIHLHTLGAMLKDYPQLQLGAQNCHFAEKGAYTGEISVEMLRSAYAAYVLVGHSERRTHFGETDAVLAKKVRAALDGGLTPIFCLGEPLHVREANQEEAHVANQLEQGLFHLSAADMERVILAYEPVWAIGTGKTATPEQAQAMHRFIRTRLAQQYSPELAERITILYGGSCNATNAKQLFSQPDVDGGLIGGASLQAIEFAHIVHACAQQSLLA